MLSWAKKYTRFEMYISEILNIKGELLYILGIPYENFKWNSNNFFQQISKINLHAWSYNQALRKSKNIWKALKGERHIKYSRWKKMSHMLQKQNWMQDSEWGLQQNTLTFIWNKRLVEKDDENKFKLIINICTLYIQQIYFWQMVVTCLIIYLFSTKI